MTILVTACNIILWLQRVKTFGGDYTNKIQIMSDSEKEIMKIIWDNGGSIFIADLLKQVEKQNKEWKRATVRTFVSRLIDKGFIKTERHGKMCEYIATVSENEYLEEQVQTFVNDIFDGSVKGLLTSLFGQKSLKKDEMEELKIFWEKGKEDINE